jgi:hypothetical protein
MRPLWKPAAALGLTLQSFLPVGFAVTGFDIARERLDLA